MRKIAFAVSLLALMALAGGQAPKAATVHVDFKEYTLANGMKVILAEDHHAPTVSLSVMYDVGSRNEKAGRTGLAHLFEHLMFEGSENVGKGEYYYYVFNNGGNMNGTTSKDRTVYYETLPANQLDLGLFLESDRMRALTVTQNALDNQRNAVQEERRLSVDNQPYGLTDEVLEATAYDLPAYQHSIIGSMTDLNAATLADAVAFYKTYYAPDNAVLALVGDFDSAAALAKIKLRFEKIPRQPAPPPVSMDQPAQTAERRKTITDAFASLPQVNLAFRGPAGNTADWYALDVLGDVLAKGDSSRLYLQLVDGQQIATNSISAGPEEMRGPSLFYVQATPRPGKNPAVIERALETAIADIQKSGITAEELSKTITQDRTDLILRDQSTLSRAITLCTDKVFFQDPALINTEIDAYNRVTAADVQRVANQYLTVANRTVLITLPAEQKATPAAGVAADSKAPQLSKIVHLGRGPVNHEPLQVTLPKPVTTHLPNGLQVIILEDHRLPLVTTSLQVWGAGPLYAPAQQQPVAVLAASLLTHGTTTRGAADIATQSADLGANLVTGASYGGQTATLLASGRSDNFPQWFALAEDVILHPAYPQGELDNYLARSKIQLSSQRSSAAFLAAERFNQAIFGTFPAGVVAPTADELDAVTRDQLLAWHQRQYDPENAILAIAGDVDAAALTAKLENDFRAWVPTGASDKIEASLAPAHTSKVYLIDRPGSVQTTLALGNLGLNRLSPDYFADVVLNQVFGAGPQSRLFLNLREEHGYTYGVYSSINAQRFPGPWRAGGDVRTAVTDASLTEMVKEITRLRTVPVPADELDTAKRSIVANFALSLESPAQLVSYAITQKQYGFPDNYWDVYPAKIMAVTSTQVQTLALRYYNPAALQIVAVGDAAKIKDALAKYGPVQTFGTDGKPVAAGGGQ